jgi:hypothetical protein
VPDWRDCLRVFFYKAQSPGLRGFGVFGAQDLFESGLGFVRDSGSWCVEAVHTKQMWEQASQLVWLDL